MCPERATSSPLPCPGSPSGSAHGPQDSQKWGQVVCAAGGAGRSGLSHTVGMLQLTMCVLVAHSFFSWVVTAAFVTCSPVDGVESVDSLGFSVFTGVAAVFLPSSSCTLCLPLALPGALVWRWPQGVPGPVGEKVFGISPSHTTLAVGACRYRVSDLDFF